MVAQLRDLAHGIYPAILTEAGLGPAVWSLADEAPLPVEVGRVPEARFPTPVERAVYVLVGHGIDLAAQVGGRPRAGRSRPRRRGADGHHRPDGSGT